MLTKIQVWRLFPQHFIPTWNHLFGERIPFHLPPPECNAWVSMRTETLTISFPLECPSGLQTFLRRGRGRMYKTTENQKCESLSHSFFQKIFPTQRSKLGLPNCRQILYRLNHQGSPRESKSSTTQLPPSHGTIWTQLCRNTGFPGHRQSCIREETDTHPEKPVCIPGPAPPGASCSPLWAGFLGSSGKVHSCPAHFTKSYKRQEFLSVFTCAQHLSLYTHRPLLLACLNPPCPLNSPTLYSPSQVCIFHKALPDSSIFKPPSLPLSHPITLSVHLWKT